VELCLIGIVLGRSVPAFPRSRHSCRSVSYHVFDVEVSWDRCRSVPECLDAEVSGNRLLHCSANSFTYDPLYGVYTIELSTDKDKYSPMCYKSFLAGIDPGL